MTDIKARSVADLWKLTQTQYGMKELKPNVLEQFKIMFYHGISMAAAVSLTNEMNKDEFARRAITAEIEVFMMQTVDKDLKKYDWDLIDAAGQKVLDIDDSDEPAKPDPEEADSVG